MLTKSPAKLFRLCSMMLIAVCCLTLCLPVNTAFCHESETSSTARNNGSPVAVGPTIKGTYSGGVTLTRWVDPQGRNPITYVEWKAQIGERGGFDIKFVGESSRSKSTTDQTGFCIIVNSSLYDSARPSVDQYALDLTGEGYNVEVYTASGGTPADLRSFLKGRYSSGVEGCVLIGDLPVAWFETDFGDPPEHAEFPIDLFYMDMNGVFADSDGDDLFDSHTGDVAPEIWVGRLTASPLTLDGADEVSLVQNYFHKNHLYRSGLLPLNNRALVYIDDDWVPWADWWDLNVGEAYGERTFVKDEWTTWDTDYENRLPVNYEFIQVCVHSYSGGHAFKNPDEEWGWTFNWEMKAIEPVAYFYNLFACSNARYVETDYMSGWYIFGPDYGLAALGSTKSGSMLYFEDFYRPWGDGKAMGEAFLDWFVARASGGFEEWEISWFYGMTLNGDPTLLIQEKSTNDWLQYDDGDAQYMSSMPNSSGWDLYNVRFTAPRACTLATVTVDGYFPGSPAARLYIWTSDGTYPASVIDSVDVPRGAFPSSGTAVIDISGKNVAFGQGEEFHIGITNVDPTPGDTLWIYMDNGEPPQYRSCLYDNGSWRTLYDVWGHDYNFLMRAEVRYPPEPEVVITTTTLPDGGAGWPYDQTLKATGGLSPYSWDVSAGLLPDGLSLDSSTGAVSGVPTTADTFNFTIRATDSDSPPLSDIQHLSIVIAPAICGDVDVSGGEPNVADLTFLVDYLFLAGPPPPVMEAANVDGKGGINVVDVSYLADYLFFDGPDPDCQPVE